VCGPRAIKTSIERLGQPALRGLVAFILERNLPVDDIHATKLAEEILKAPPKQGYLTISNALQWRLHYSRIIQ